MPTLEAAAELVNGRYRLHRPIGSGGMGVVYEAYDRLTGQTVALKRVTTGSASDPSPIPVDRQVLSLHLAREFQLLASLRHPNIISVLDYGVERMPGAGEPHLFYTMELMPGARSILEAGRFVTFSEKIRLLVELLEALVYLHRRGILHCDLKPENVLVAGSGQVKVVDFGLSSLREHIDMGQEGGSTAGTLTYMAPELLQGGRVSPASDLFAVGVIAYELLTGRYPFDRATIASLIQGVLRVEPDLTPFYLIDLPPPSPPPESGTPGEIWLSDAPTLASVIRGLLEKSPEQRSADAREVIDRLIAAGLPVQRERQEVRDSFLQGAQFVGRTRETNQLRLALTQMLNGKGSAYLIGGESGIGKSRLLNELRTYALTSGVQVVTGQAVEGGGVPYQLWRDPLRRLALTTPLSDFQAGVLKDLIPDIETLLERPIPDAPPLDGREEKRRRLRTLTEVLRMQTTPTLLLLEDLHWARESLDALEALLPLVREQALLIIGSYRIDENDALPDLLPDMIPMRLGRLSPNEIDTLGRSMLGENATGSVIDLLRQETEGNVLFIVEVLRSMADEAGALERIGGQTLPFRTVAEGIESVLRRRLRRIPEDARALLDVAAVAGRALDLKVMETIWRAEPILRPAGSLDSWLVACSNAAALEFFDDAWRFTHDKLRNVLVIDVMERGDLAATSAAVARAIEAAYPNPAELGLRAADLADHWRNAENPVREAAALEMAVALALDQALYERALEHIARARPLVKDDAERTARLAAQANEAQYSLGQLDRARESGHRALTLFGYTLYDLTRPWQQTLPYLMLRVPWVQVRAALQARRRSEVRSLSAVKVLERMVMIHYFQNDRSETAYYSLLSLNPADELNPARRLERAHGHATATVALASSRPHLSRFFMRLTDRALAGVADSSAIIWALLCTGITAVITGDFDDAERRLLRGRALAKETGSIRRLEEALVTLAGLYYYQSRWDETRAVSDELHALATQYGDLQGVGWALDNQGRFALRRGRFEEARATFQRGYDTYSKINDRVNGVWCLGAIAKTYLCEGDLDAARPYVEQVVEALFDTPQTSFGMTEPFSAAAEYYLTLWEVRRDQDAVTRADAALAALGRYAAIFRVARPRYLALSGWRRRLEGDRGAALRLGRRAVKAAARLGMPYDEAVARVELARHLPRHHPLVEDSLKRAIAIFEGLDAAYDKGRAQRMLYDSER
ncbi:MAG: protein kinase [Anaerolineae bacterium]|nr:protein kinase [Anaerolineae bacterium]